jgi:hypothetical protein
VTSSPTAPTMPETAAPPLPAPDTTSATLARATTPSCPPIPARRTPDPARPRYSLELDARPATGVVEGMVDVRFTPDLPTDRLVFRLWANGPRQRGEGGHVETGQVEVEGRAVESVVQDPTTLVAPLATPLGAGQTVLDAT